MPRQTAIASATGLIAGVSITAALTDDVPHDPVVDLVLPLFAQLAPLICLTIISCRAVRKWLDTQAVHTRRQLEAAADQRQRFRQDIEARLAEVARREDALAVSASAKEHCTELHQALADERAAHARLRAEHDELADAFNETVVHSLQQSATFFRPRPTPADSAAEGIRIPLPARRTAYASGAAHHQVHGAADSFGRT